MSELRKGFLKSLTDAKQQATGVARPWLEALASGKVVAHSVALGVGAGVGIYAGTQDLNMAAVGGIGMSAYTAWTQGSNAWRKVRQGVEGIKDDPDAKTDDARIEAARMEGRGYAANAGDKVSEFQRGAQARRNQEGKSGLGTYEALEGHKAAATAHSIHGDKPRELAAWYDGVDAVAQEHATAGASHEAEAADSEASPSTQVNALNSPRGPDSAASHPVATSGEPWLGGMSLLEGAENPTPAPDGHDSDKPGQGSTDAEQGSQVPTEGESAQADEPTPEESVSPAQASADDPISSAPVSSQAIASGDADEAVQELGNQEPAPGDEASPASVAPSTDALQDDEIGAAEGQPVITAAHDGELGDDGTQGLRDDLGSRTETTSAPEVPDAAGALSDRISATAPEAPAEDPVHATNDVESEPLTKDVIPSDPAVPAHIDASGSRETAPSQPTVEDPAGSSARTLDPDIKNAETGSASQDAGDAIGTQTSSQPAAERAALGTTESPAEEAPEPERTSADAPTTATQEPDKKEVADEGAGEGSGSSVSDPTVGASSPDASDPDLDW